MQRLSTAEALARVGRLMSGAPRVLLGLAGPPGAGKSTLAERIVAEHPGAALVGMDAFHLATETLAGLGLVERKGAPETFDADGYVALLRRLRAGEPRTVWVGQFRRELEDTIAAVVGVAPGCPLVVTEGNYLLLDGPWAPVRELLDEVWYLDVPEPVRVERLVGRHVRYGRDAVAARARATSGVDGANARLVATSRHLADVLLTDC